MDVWIFLGPCSLISSYFQHLENGLVEGVVARLGIGGVGYRVVTTGTFWVHVVACGHISFLEKLAGTLGGSPASTVLQ
jgi:hypothetical protein